MAPSMQTRPCLRLLSQRTRAARFCTSSSGTPHPPSQAKEESIKQLGISTRKEYNVRKARLHASLWQQEIQKQFGEASPTTNRDSVVASIDSSEPPKVASVAMVENSIPADSHPENVEMVENSIPADSHHGNVGKVEKYIPEGWESFVQQEEFDDEITIKEENMLLEEFERRKEHNRIRIANFVKQHLYSRRRPVDGWKYIVNSFGSENRATAMKVDDRESRLSDLEKIALKREAKYRR